MRASIIYSHELKNFISKLEKIKKAAISKKKSIEMVEERFNIPRIKYSRDLKLDLSATKRKKKQFQKIVELIESLQSLPLEKLK